MLHDDLGKARERNVRGSWSNHTRKLDMHNIKDDNRATLTNFSAILELRERRTDNCSVDDHAALDTCFLSEAREITLTNGSISKTCRTDV